MIHPCLQVLASGVITDDALVAAGPPGDPSVESLRVSGSGKHDSLFLCLYLKMSGTFVHINLCVYSSYIFFSMQAMLWSQRRDSAAAPPLPYCTNTPSLGKSELTAPAEPLAPVELSDLSLTPVTSEDIEGSYQLIAPSSGSRSCTDSWPSTKDDENGLCKFRESSSASNEVFSWCKKESLSDQEITSTSKGDLLKVCASHTYEIIESGKCGLAWPIADIYADGSEAQTAFQSSASYTWDNYWLAPPALTGDHTKSPSVSDFETEAPSPMHNRMELNANGVVHSQVVTGTTVHPPSPPHAINDLRGSETIRSMWSAWFTGGHDKGAALSSSCDPLSGPPNHPSHMLSSFAALACPAAEGCSSLSGGPSILPDVGQPQLPATEEGFEKFQTMWNAGWM